MKNRRKARLRHKINQIAKDNSISKSEAIDLYQTRRPKRFKLKLGVGIIKEY
jgi:hypothetical protein